MAHLLRSPLVSSSDKKIVFPSLALTPIVAPKRRRRRIFGLLSNDASRKREGEFGGRGKDPYYHPPGPFSFIPLSPSSQSPKQKKALNRSSKIEEKRWFLFRSRTESFSISCIFPSSSSFSHTFEYLFCILGTLDDWRRRRRPNRFVSLFLSPPRNLLGFSL